MNAEYRAPGDDGQQSSTPAEPAPRREGVLGASSQVPQRTAFRPVTGTQTQGAPNSGTQAPAAPGAAPASIPPVRTAPGAAPASTPPVRTAAGASAATVAGQKPASTTVPSPFPAATSAPQRATAGAVPARAATVKPGDVTASGAPRKVRVLLASVDPWSVLKLGFLLSIAAGIMLVVAVHIVWSVLNSMGTFDMANDWVNRLFPPGESVDILQFVEYSKVMSATILVAVTNVLLLSGLSVVAAFLYNIVAKVVGGVYMTLTDD